MKVALVTGGSRGIGQAIAENLARQGMLVAITYSTNSGAAQKAVEKIRFAGGKAFALQVNIGSVSEIHKMFQQLDAELQKLTGVREFDILVNNAGTQGWSTVAETDEKEFDRLFEINTKGTFFVTQQALTRLRDHGRIITISSGSSKRPAPQLSVYAMTKAALSAMTFVLAADLGARGIAVNEVAPGWTATDINAEARKSEELVRQVSETTAMGRLGTADDIAGVVGFLASGDSGWITGQYIEASGGYRLVMPTVRVAR